MKTLNKHMSRSEQVYEFQKELEFICKKIEQKEHMALVRWGDGEYFLLREKNLYPQISDKWGWKGGPSNVKDDMIKCFGVTDLNFYHGITCEEWSFRYNNDAMNYLIGQIKQPIEYITYASLFIDDNYKYFTKWFSEFRNNNEIVYIVNEVCNIPNATVHTLPHDLVNLYETQNTKLIEKYQEIAKEHHDTVFFFAGGPVAKCLIYYMWKENPNNTYIDVGSAIDEFTKKTKTRNYQRTGSKEEKRKGKEFTKDQSGKVKFI